VSTRILRHLLPATLLLCTRVSAADDTDDLRSVLSESVVTTASTSAEKASTAPATSIALSAEDLRTYGIRSLDEAINFLSLGVVTSDPLRTPDIGARGVLLPRDDGRHFLLLVNGHALNDPLYGAARFDQGSGVPIEIIDRIEVIVGPGSVLYGSNAMMGVINVITKDGAHYRGGHVVGEHEPGASARAGAGLGFTFSAFGQPGEVMAHAGYFNRFGPDLDFERQPYSFNAGYNAPTDYGPKATPGYWGGTVRDAYFTEVASGIVRARLGELELNLFGSAYRRGIPYAAGGMNVDFDDPESRELDRALRIDIKHQATLSPLVQLTSRVYADSFDYQRRLNRNAAFGCFRTEFRVCQYYEVGIARWVGVEPRLALNWLEDSSVVTLLGIDARLRSVQAKEDALDADTERPFAPSAGVLDDSALLLSPYLQQTFNPARWLGVNLGARLDADSRFNPIVSPRAALAFTPLSGTTFKAIYSQAFRAPSWAETNPTNRRQLRSPGIEPEIVRSVEGSLEQRFQAQRLFFGVFRTWWSNLIEPHLLSSEEVTAAQNRGELPITSGNSQIIQYQNLSDLENYGWNGGWSGSLVDGRFTYGINATGAFTRRRFGSERLPLTVGPQLFGNAHTAYAFGDPLPTLGVAVRYVGERAVDRAFDSGFSPAPRVPGALELRGNVSGAVPFIRGLSYHLAVNYVTLAEGPYVVGGTQRANASTSSPFLNPVDTFTVFYGLRYDFLSDSETISEGQ
jgi:outer membrane receptor for ferrienterochelin and colicins